MAHLTQHDVMVVFLALAALLASAKFAGELVKKFNQPSVLGEILAGIALGPTILGRFAPQVYDLLFPSASFVWSVNASAPTAAAGGLKWPCPMRGLTAC